jgi:hypothetical protein
MDLSFLERGYNKVLFDRLRESQLHHYIKPMQDLFILEKQQKIKLSRVSLKKLMRTVYMGTRKDLEMQLQAFLLHYGLIHPPKPKNKPKPASVRERVRKHRERLKKRGYRAVTAYFSEDELAYIKKIKHQHGYSSYAELFYSCVRSQYGY